MTQKDRDQVIADLSQEGWNLKAIKTLLRGAERLHTLAELACSSEAADRDRVPCPAGTEAGGHCLCDFPGGPEHETVPRIAVEAARLERRLTAVIESQGARAKFGGDPRGFVCKVLLPSGRHNSWGGKEEGYGIG